MKLWRIMITINMNKNDWREQLIKDFQSVGIVCCDKFLHLGLVKLFNSRISFKVGSRRFDIEQNFKHCSSLIRPFIKVLNNIVTIDVEKFLEYLKNLDEKKSVLKEEKNLVKFDSELFEIRLYSEIKNLDYTVNNLAINNKLSENKFISVKFEIYSLTIFLELHLNNKTYEEISNLDLFNENWNLEIDDINRGWYSRNDINIKETLHDILKFLSNQNVKDLYKESVVKIAEDVQKIEELDKEIEQIKKDLDWRNSEKEQLNLNIRNRRSQIFNLMKANI